MSIFHRMKKAVVGQKQEAGTPSLCPEYDAIRSDFESLHDTMLRIRQQLLTYREANSRMWTSATTLSTEFANMLETPPAASAAVQGAGDDHPYQQMAATMRASHGTLPAERERLETMLNACLFPLKEQLAKYEELKARMADHDKQKDEVVYYQGKVTGLKQAREASKKAESAADRDKYERNVKKMADQEAAFHAMDTQLVAELRYAFEHRVAVLGPIMLAFVCAERQMAASYTQAIEDVKLVDVNEANAWLARHEAAMAAKQVHVQTITTSKTIVTDIAHSPATPALTVTTVDHKATSAANVPSTVLPLTATTAAAGTGVAVGALSTSGVVVSEPHFASSTLGTGDLQSPTSSSKSFNSSEIAWPEPFDTATTSAAAGATTSAASSSNFYSDPFADPFATPKGAAADASAAAVGATTHGVEDPFASTNAALSESSGVPYTIGSTATHHAASTTSTAAAATLPATHTATAATTGGVLGGHANGTASAFPVESSSAAHSAAATMPDLLTSTPPVMDDMALEKSRGAEQLAPMHGAVAGAGVQHDALLLDKHDATATKSALDGSSYGVGEKTDMFAAPTAGASPVV